MTTSDHNPAPGPVSRRRRRLLYLAAGTALLVLIAGGWWLTTTITEPAPTGPSTAGATVCQPQVAINFHDDGDLRDHEQELRGHPRVSAVALETQQQVLDSYRTMLATAGHPELGKLVRIEAMPARIWLAALPGELEQVRAEVHASLGLAAEGVWVTNPCTNQTLSGSTPPSPTPAPLSR